MIGDIPKTWLNSFSIDLGWFPTVGVGRRGTRVVIRTSRSIYVLSLLMLAAGIMLCTLDVGPFVVFGPVLIVGAMGAAVGVPTLQWRFGTGLEVDLAERTATMTRREGKRVFPFDRIVAFQQLDSPRRGGGQLNLVFLNEEGAIDRTCIYTHAIGYYVRRIARNLARHVPWPVIGPDGRPIG